MRCLREGAFSELLPLRVSGGGGILGWGHFSGGGGGILGGVISLHTTTFPVEGFTWGGVHEAMQGCLYLMRAPEPAG